MSDGADAGCELTELLGLDMDRSTLAGWVGKSAALLEPLAEAIKRHVLSGQAIFADDTPVKMLAPGNGTTKTARFWAYDTLNRIADHKINRIDELLPWNYRGRKRRLPFFMQSTLNTGPKVCDHLTPA